MYNYYLDQKLKQKAETRTIDTEKQMKLKAKRQLAERPKLIQSYESRIQGFLYQMASNPIKLKEVKQTICSTREELYAEEADKIIGSKGFIFNKHKSDKEKSDEYVLKKRASEMLNNNAGSQELSRNLYEINQPFMRFKPRTDMERICEIVQGYRRETQGKGNQLELSSRKAAQRQWRKYQSRLKESASVTSMTGHNIHINNGSDNDYIAPPESENVAASKLKKNKSYSYQPKIKRIDNSEAKKIYPELYNKTYFKAIENYSLMKESCVLNHEKLGTTEAKLFDGYHYPRRNKHRKVLSLGGIDFSNRNLSEMHQPDKCPINSRSTQKDLMTILTACNQQYSSPKDKELQLLKSLESVDKFTTCMTKSKERREKVDKHKLALLEQLAFHNSKTIESNERKAAMMTKKNKRDVIYPYEHEDSNPQQMENRITIDGTVYDRNDTYNIAKKILSTCNWTHHKSKEANKTHLSRNGKLMCTGGLTISQFEQKHHLKPIVK